MVFLYVFHGTFLLRDGTCQRGTYRSYITVLSRTSKVSERVRSRKDTRVRLKE